MLQKALATLSTLIYLAVTTGVMVNMHYCMNEFDSAQLYAGKTDVCGRCGMHTTDSDGCCHDELKVVKLNEDHNISQLNYEMKTPVALPANFNNFISDLKSELLQNRAYLAHSPPLLSLQEIYLQNCVFRI